MEGIGQIIILIVIVVASVVQQLLKAKKKKQEQGQDQPGTAKKASFEDVWRDMFETEESPEPSPYIFKTEKDSTETAGIRKHESRASGAKPGRGEGFPHSEKAKQQASQPLNKPLIIAVDYNNEEQGELVKDFDIRKAIIYTEIMTPKFREGEGR